MSETDLSVLVVDADPARREVLRRTIESGLPGARVSPAGSLRECREALSAGPPDVVVLGAELPDGDPLAPLVSPPEEGPCPFVVASVDGGASRAVEAMRAGAIDYVSITDGGATGLAQVVGRARRDWLSRRESRRAEEEIRESELRLRQVVEHTEIGFWISRPESAGPEFLRPACGRKNSCEEPLCLSRPSEWMERVRPEEREEALASFLSPLAGEPSDVTFAYRRPDGTLAWLRNRGFPVRDAAGRVIRASGATEDVSRRVEAQAETDRAAERIREQNRLISELAVSEAVASGQLAAVASLLTESVARRIGIERVGVWLFDPTGRELRCVDLYELATGRHSAGDLLREEMYRSEFEALRGSKFVDASEALTDPRTAGYAEGYLKPLGITSLLDGVVVAGGRAAGVVCLERVGVSHRWHPDETSFVCQLADQLGITLANQRRKRAEEVLRGSEARLRTITTNAPDTIMQVSPGGTVLFVNRTMPGISFEEVVGASVFEWVPETEEETVRSAIEWALENRTRQEYETTGPGPNGSRRRYRVGVMPVVVDGRAESVILQATDITERNQAMEDLAKSEERFRLAMNAVRDVLWDWDVASGQVYFSPAAVEILDFEPGDSPRPAGRWLDRIHPDDRHDALTAPNDCIDGRVDRYESEYRVRMKGDGWKWILTRGSAVARDGAGRATRILGTHTDITARKQAEEALARSEERFRLTMEAARDVLWDWDLESESIYFSPSLAEVFGLDRDEIPKTPGAWIDRIHPEDRERGLSEIRECIEGRSDRFEVEFRIRGKDGAWKWLLDRGSVVARSADGRAARILGTRSDIDERRRLQEEHEALRERSVAMQKLEGLGRLAGGIAHDFNNILLGIVGNAEVALLEIPAGSPGRECLGEILAASERAARLAKQMLAYSGRGRFEVRPIDLATAISGMKRLVEAALPKSTRLRTELEPSIPPVKGDLSQIEQVVMNLVINASEALDPAKGGSVVVRTAVRSFDDQELSASRIPEKPAAGTFVVLEIGDDGLGMDEVTRERLFDPFFSTKFVGRGLGLSAVFGIVRGHGGAIFVESAPGQGTTFRVLFPAAGPAEPLRPGAKDGEREPGWRGSGRILLVDDEETIRKVAPRLLASLGFETTCVADGAAALEALRGADGGFACALVGLSMPGPGGDEVARRIRAAGSRIPVVLMSGFSEEELRERHADSEISAFLQKPFDRESLGELLRRILGG